MKSLIFFDDACPFCWKAVARLIAWDHRGIFLFTPLKGKSAKKHLTPSLSKQDTMILYEHYEKFWIRGKGVLRAIWMLGGAWKLIGWLCFFPILPDLVYRWVASHRQSTGASMAERCMSRYPNRFIN